MAAAAKARAHEASQKASERTAEAEYARRRAAEAIEDAFRHGNDSSRRVHIPGNAFNAGTAFTSLFAATAVVGVVLFAKAADELRKMHLHVQDIRDELGAQTTAMVQGWQNDGFGAFIYRFLRQEIDEASEGQHRFYVYNPTTSADVAFKERVREQPLPPSFGGFSSDLEAIFRLMWANRQTLRATMPRDAADAIVFHLLVPAKRTMAVLDRMVIDKSIGRLIIRGHMDEGSCYAWFNFVYVPRQVILHEVRNINTKPIDKERMVRQVETIMLCGFAYLMWVILSPRSSWFNGPVKILGVCGFLLAYIYVAEAYLLIPAPRVLGPPPDEKVEKVLSFEDLLYPALQVKAFRRLIILVLDILEDGSTTNHARE